MGTGKLYIIVIILLFTFSVIPGTWSIGAQTGQGPDATCHDRADGGSRGTHVITTTDMTTAREDRIYKVDYEVSDPGNITDLVWTLSPKGTWLRIDPKTGVLTGIPLNTDVGSTQFDVSVLDGQAFLDSHQFTINVENEQPTVMTYINEIVLEDQPYRLDYNSDDDGQGNITWLMTSKDNSWLSIDPKSGVIEGTPQTKDIGRSYMKVWVDDGNGGIGKSNLYVTVEKLKDPPVIISQPINETYVDINYSYQVLYKNPYYLNNLVTNLMVGPPGMVIKDDSIYWRPVRGQEGLNEVVIEGHYEKSAVMNKKFSINVRPHLFVSVHRPYEGQNVTDKITVRGTVLGPFNVTVLVMIDNMEWTIAKGNSTWEKVLDTRMLFYGKHSLKVKAVWQGYSTEELCIGFNVIEKPKTAMTPGFSSGVVLLVFITLVWLSKRTSATSKGGR
jgi:hypothetical protein